MFNNSPALYRNICSTFVQILGDLSVWTAKLCFSEVRKHLNLNSKILPLHYRFIFYHKGQLWHDSIRRLLHISTQFFFVIEIHIVYLKTVPGLSDTPLR